MTTLIIKTNVSQATDVLIKDMGIIIPSSGGQETLTRPGDLEDARISQNLRTLTTDDAYGAGSSTLILNDGTNDIPQDDTENHLDFVNVGAPPPKNNFAVVNPTSTNDDSEGYSVNSLWTNILTQKTFICVDAAASNAIWIGQASGVVLASSTGPGHYHDRQEALTGTIASTNTTDWIDMPGMMLATRINDEEYEYIITFTCEASGSSSSKDVFVRITVDDMPVIESEREIRPQSGNQFFIISTSSLTSVVPGSDAAVIKVQWESESTQQTFSVQGRSLIIDGVPVGANI